jgi:hypothetical protein
VFREVEHDKLVDDYGAPERIRQMIRITDTLGQADPLEDNSNAEFSIISENIWDMQIAYKAYENFTGDTSINRHTDIDPNHLYFTKGSAYSDTYSAFNALMQDIRDRKIKQIDVTIIAIADEMGGRGDRADTGNIPQIGDNPSPYLPSRKLGYRLFSFSVEPKNYSIFY